MSSSFIITTTRSTPTTTSTKLATVLTFISIQIVVVASSSSSSSLASSSIASTSISTSTSTAVSIFLALPLFVTSFVINKDSTRTSTCSFNNQHNNIRFNNFNKLLQEVSDQDLMTRSTNTITYTKTNNNNKSPITKESTTTTTSSTNSSTTMTRTTFVQRLLKVFTIQSLFIGGTSFITSSNSNNSRTAAFALSSSPNESNNNSNTNKNSNNSNSNNSKSNNSNNNDHLKDLFNDETTYGFEDGTTFSMTSTYSDGEGTNYQNNNNIHMKTKPKVAYRPLAIRNIKNFDGVVVPVAMWFRPDDDDDKDNINNDKYSVINDNNEKDAKANDNGTTNEKSIGTNIIGGINNDIGIGKQQQQGGRKSKLIMDYPSIVTSIPATSTYSSSSSSSSSISSSSNGETKTDSSQQQQQQPGEGAGHSITYKHRISIKKIGSMLARLDFIPEFLSKDFTLEPTSTSSTIIDGTFEPLPKSSTSTNIKSNSNTSNDSSNSINKPVVILSHGFLGSRFDLSHIGEALALEGFIVFSPEYPESLSSSYESTKIVTGNTLGIGNGNEKENENQNQYEIKLDRATINEELLKLIKDDLNIQPLSYGIVGHSLGTGTAMNTGDDSWTRVCIAGPPIRRRKNNNNNNGIIEYDDNVRGSVLSILSVNDGAVTMNRISTMIPDSFVRLDESRLFPKNDNNNNNNVNVNVNDKNLSDLPPKSILIIDRNDAPNHISFLAGNVNDAMVSFLSPLLPVAQALNIPVLDFDKYKESRDSVATSQVVIPLVSSFLKQYMIVE